MKPRPEAERRLEAITRLAVATREKAEPQTFQVYLENTAHIRLDVLVEAGRRLEKSSQWFPKVSELLEMCNLVAKEQRIREELNRPRLNPPPEPDPERLRMWLEKIRKASSGLKDMPSAEIPDPATGGKTLKRVK